jgi:hypothetical protein
MKRYSRFSFYVASAAGVGEKVEPRTKGCAEAASLADNQIVPFSLGSYDR